MRDQLLEGSQNLEVGTYEEVFDFVRIIDLLRDELIAWSKTYSATLDWYSSYLAEVQNVRAAPETLQAKAAEAPANDWRSALIWQATEDTGDCFQQKLFDAIDCNHKPANFQHWRERYMDDFKL